MKKNRISILALLLALVAALNAATFDRATYYAAANGKKGEALKTALAGIIYDHTKVGYGNLMSAYVTTDVRPDGKVWDMYSNVTNYDFTGWCPSLPGGYTNGGDAAGAGLNREHVVPQSTFGSTEPMHSDLYHVYPTDAWVNNRRSNNCFGYVLKSSNESANGFCKLGTPNTSLMPGCTEQKVFEVNDMYKGDIARSYFYFVTAYESRIGSFGDKWSNYGMFDGTTYPAFTTWAQNTMLLWSQIDVVSEKETNRIEAVYAIQHNRNPFIDFPGLEQYIWGTYKDVAFNASNYVNPYSGVQPPVVDPTPQDPETPVVATSGTYTFTSNAWAATYSEDNAAHNWEHVKNGGQLTSGQGIQVTKTVASAYGTSPDSFTGVTSVVVRYCTNKSAGKGTIKVSVGGTEIGTENITAPNSNGTSLRDLTFTPDTPIDGKITVEVTCSTNSIYIYSVTVNTASGSTDVELLDPSATLDTSDAILTLNETLTRRLNTNSDGTVSYTSSNEAVATVDANGKVTAVGVGSATITASVPQTEVYNAISLSYAVTVNAPAVTPATGSTTYVFTSKSWAAKSPDETVHNWTSGKEGLGFVSGQGIQVTTGVTGANGTSPDSFTGVTSLVVKYCTNASKGEGDIMVSVGGTPVDNLHVKSPGSNGTSLRELTFTPSTPLDGTVTISVDCTTNSIYIYGVTVNVGGQTTETSRIDPTASFARTNMKVLVGNTFTQTLTTTSDGIVTYTSSDEAVATVNQSGKVTAIAAGTAIITASVPQTDTYNAVSLSYTVTVEEPEMPLDGKVIYYFNSRDWKATGADGSAQNWTSGAMGNEYTTGKGVQVTQGYTGANATSPDYFTNVTSVVVRYCTNPAKGKGDIVLNVGSTTVGTQHVQYNDTEDTTGEVLREVTFTPITPLQGYIQFTVNCTENSIYIYSVVVTGTISDPVTDPNEPNTDEEEVTREVIESTEGEWLWATEKDFFYESFDTNNGTGGNDGQWSGSVAAQTAWNADNTGWQITNGYKANQCIKLGKGTGGGIAITPAVHYAYLPETLTLTFRAGAWGSDAVTLNVSASSGTLSETSVTMVRGVFSDFSLTLSNAQPDVRITFSSSIDHNARFFLDEVKLTGQFCNYQEYGATTTRTVLIGDANMDGRLTVGDVAATIAILMQEDEGLFDKAAADVLYEDGIVTKADLEALINKVKKAELQSQQ